MRQPTQAEIDAADRALDADLEQAVADALWEATEPDHHVDVSTFAPTATLNAHQHFMGVDLGLTPDAVVKAAALDRVDGRPWRRRWVYTQGGEALPEPIEVTDDWANTERGVSRTSEEEIYGHVRATDGTVLDTRRKHRQYMRDHGLTLASDYEGQWTKQAKERERAFTDPSYDRSRRIEHLKNAFEKYRNRR